MLGLFDLNDGLDRTWESCPFRRLVRRLWETISSAVDADCANRWLKVSLVRDAGCHLNCVPIYERDKLYKFQKAAPANSKETRETRLSGQRSICWIAAYEDFPARADKTGKRVPIYRLCTSHSD